MQRRTKENTEERKCEARPVGLLSSRREAHFYLPRNKDKSETRTNDIRDRSFQPKRSARQAHAFVSWTFSQGYTMHETSERIVGSSVSLRAFRRLPFPIVIFTFVLFFHFLLSYNVHDQKNRNYIKHKIRTFKYRQLN